jgi:hypothetical protein
VPVFFGRNHMMGVKNPNSFEQSKVLSSMFEKKKEKENHNANPSCRYCRCLEGNLSFCRGMMGDVGRETPHKY